MQYKTHLATSFALGLPLMASVQQVTPLNLFALGVGCLLPDIDQPQSFVGKRNKLFSKVTNKTFGHRGATHSLLALIVLFLLLTFLQVKYLTTAGQPLVFWLLIGYFLHLLEDTFSKDAVAWLWPFKKKKRRKDKVLFYKTGSVEEYLLLALMCCVLLLELRLITLNRLENQVLMQQMTRLQQVFESCQNFIEKL